MAEDQNVDISTNIAHISTHKHALVSDSEINIIKSHFTVRRVMTLEGKVLK